MKLKKYHTMDNVGTVKYLVNYHNGHSLHNDGSPFYDIALFSNKRKRDAFVKGLAAQGYTSVY